MTTNTTKPVHRIRYGSVVAAIWANNSSVGYFYDTTFSKVYKQGDTWADSYSFEDRDLPNLAKAAADAHTWIYQRKAEATTVSASGDPQQCDRADSGQGKEHAA
jgi:hypothetical protein